MAKLIADGYINNIDLKGSNNTPIANVGFYTGKDFGETQFMTVVVSKKLYNELLAQDEQGNYTSLKRKVELTIHNPTWNIYQPENSEKAYQNSNGYLVGIEFKDQQAPNADQRSEVNEAAA